ncbi:response regulator transcription factor [Aeromicrobium sp. 9AM]|uniref:LuxR C-terminal-related transcriptional regulator n=1 Tax=Aeromicrobium sp. 9AM TaxID=2653126 RepID=UPI0012F1AA57|nr:response regulator transcription factor [Aeromicrobium sp. 9AM]VXC13398.1 DNA-binding response regulator [Aeromicrobium sp. 9AM]
MRIVIADDSGLLRAGLSNLLVEAGHEVVGTAPDGEGVEALVQLESPDLVILDIRMPPTYTYEGARAAVDLRERHPDLGILLLSQSLESRYVADLVRDRPERFGYLLKDRVVDVDVLLDALASIMSGGTVLDPEVVSHLLGGRGVADQLARLSTREREVLDMMAQGLSNSAIAQRLTVEIKTVETHVARIMTKLDLPPSSDDNRRVRAVLAWLRA